MLTFYKVQGVKFQNLEKGSDRENEKNRVEEEVDKREKDLTSSSWP